MSLQSLWLLSSLNPSWALNLLALFFCVAGGWLMIATRLRAQFAGSVAARNAAEGPLQTLSVEPVRGASLNRFFMGFGAMSLVLGLAISLASRLI